MLVCAAGMSTSSWSIKCRKAEERGLAATICGASVRREDHLSEKKLMCPVAGPVTGHLLEDYRKISFKGILLVDVIFLRRTTA